MSHNLATAASSGDPNIAATPATLNCGALFAGIGGFCLGFERAGFKTAWAVELNEHACQTYHANLPTARLLCKSVEEVSVVSDALEPVDVLHAGFPCQSFSQAGERKGFDDPRGRLFFEIIRIIEEFGPRRPKVLVLENAPFLRYGEGGAWFLDLQRADVLAPTANSVVHGRVVDGRFSKRPVYLPR